MSGGVRWRCKVTSYSMFPLMGVSVYVSYFECDILGSEGASIALTNSFSWSCCSIPLETSASPESMPFEKDSHAREESNTFFGF